MGLFEIHGQAEKMVNYDIAVINITFTESGATSHLASKMVMRECEQFLEKMNSEGIKVADIILDDDTVSEDRYRDNNSVKASRGLIIRMPYDMAAINRIRQIIDENEYSIEFDLDYELSNEASIHDELLKDALLDSKRKAELLANSMGLTVKGIDSVETYTRSSGKMDWCEQEVARCCIEAPQFLMSNQLKAKEENISETIEVKWIIE